MEHYYIDGILYEWHYPDRLIPAESGVDCPKCGKFTGSFDARSCHFICLSSGCGWSRKVQSEKLDSELIKTHLRMKATGERRELHIMEISSENERLRKALTFYAEGRHISKLTGYEKDKQFTGECTTDRGEVAQKALSGS